MRACVSDDDSFGGDTDDDVVYTRSDECMSGWRHS